MEKYRNLSALAVSVVLATSIVTLPGCGNGDSDADVIEPAPAATQQVESTEHEYVPREEREVIVRNIPVESLDSQSDGDEKSIALIERKEKMEKATKDLSAIKLPEDYDKATYHKQDKNENAESAQEAARAEEAQEGAATTEQVSGEQAGTGSTVDDAAAAQDQDADGTSPNVPQTTKAKTDDEIREQARVSFLEDYLRDCFRSYFVVWARQQDAPSWIDHALTGVKKAYSSKAYRPKETTGDGDSVACPVLARWDYKLVFGDDSFHNFTVSIYEGMDGIEVTDADGAYLTGADGADAAEQQATSGTAAAEGQAGADPSASDAGEQEGTGTLEGKSIETVVTEQTEEDVPTDGEM